MSFKFSLASVCILVVTVFVFPTPTASLKLTSARLKQRVHNPFLPTVVVCHVLGREPGGDAESIFEATLLKSQLHFKQVTDHVQVFGSKYKDEAALGIAIRNFVETSQCSVVFFRASGTEEGMTFLAAKLSKQEALVRKQALKDLGRKAPANQLKLHAQAALTALDGLQVVQHIYFLTCNCQLPPASFDVISSDRNLLAHGESPYADTRVRFCFPRVVNPFVFDGQMGWLLPPAFPYFENADFIRTTVFPLGDLKTLKSGAVPAGTYNRLRIIERMGESVFFAHFREDSPYLQLLRIHPTKVNEIGATAV